MNASKNSLMAKARVQLVDCTLREGDQAPGVAMRPAEKLAIVEALDRAGVTLADAGMPELSAEERDVLRQAAERAQSMVVGASVRCRPEAVALARSCGVGSVFIICPTSRLHLDKRLGTDLQGLLERMSRAADQRGDMALDIVCEDASRAEPADLEVVINHAAELGADRLYLADTVGCRTPAMFSALVRRGLAAADGRLGIGVHCHNDLGMATANTVAAIEAGATWPTVCVNGLGERAGNADLAAVAVACKVALGRETGTDFQQLAPLSRLVEQASGQMVSARTPVVGLQAHCHESGIHVDGLLKDTRSYEVIDPELLGMQRRIVLGRHSGSAHLRALMSSRHPNRWSQLLSADDHHAFLQALRLRVQRAAGVSERSAFIALREDRDRLVASQGVGLEEFDRIVGDLSAQRLAAAAEPP